MEPHEELAEYMEDRALEKRLLPFPERDTPGREQAREVTTRLDELHSDLVALSRSHYAEPLSEYKVKLANAILCDALEFLSGYEPAARLELIDASDPLTHSDAMILVGQYRACLRSYRVNVLGENQYAV